MRHRARPSHGELGRKNTHSPGITGDISDERRAAVTVRRRLKSEMAERLASMAILRREAGDMGACRRLLRLSVMVDLGGTPPPQHVIRVAAGLPVEGRID